MKKVLFMVSIAAMLALALPAMALPAVGGTMELEGNWRQYGPTTVENQLNLGLGFDARTRAGIEFQLGNAQRFFDGLRLDQFQRGYLQRLGSLWAGGPQVVTTIGGLRFNYSPYVAWIGRNDSVEGISFEGFRNGPLSAAAFYTTDKTLGGRVEANLDQLNIAGTFVTDAEQNAIDITGKIVPLPGAQVIATYATADDSDVVKIDGSYSILPHLQLVAGYRSFDPTFDAKWHNPDWDPFYREANPVAQYLGLRGYTVGLRTGAYGMVLSADVDRYEWITTGNRADAIRLGAAKELNLAGNTIDASYELTLPDDGDLQHEVQAAYRAPNGLGIQALYNNVTGGQARVGMNVAF